VSKILVLDDSKAIADYISAILTDKGYECTSLSKPTQLLMMLQNQEYDLLLLDLYMPEIDGIQLLKTIRADAQYDNLYIIIVSSITDEHIVAQCLMDGANDFIKKPINDFILTARVHACLDRKQHTKTREALSQSSNNYHTMIDNVADGVIGFGSDGTINFINKALSIMFGYSQEQLKGKSLSILMPSVFESFLNSHTENLQQKGLKNVLGIAREMIATKEDGSLFPIEFTLNEAHKGEWKGFTGMVRDLSERRKNQKRILQFSRLMDSSLNEIFMFDTERFQFIEVNKGGRDNLGYTMDELKDKTFMGINPEFKHDLPANKLNELRTGIINKLEFISYLQRKDGSLYPVEVHLQLMPETPPIFVAMVLDITRRKKIELELIIAQRQLFQSQKLESLGALAGGIAHDFNNIMAIIEGNTELALDFAKIDSEQFEYLQSILTASDKAVQLTKQILAFSRTEVHDFKAINLVETINESLQMVRPLIPANIEIIQNINVVRSVIVGDKTQIHQIFTNIVNNASQAMEQSGGVITISISDDDKNVFMSIADTGSGIPLDEQTNIFDPFFTTKKVGKGTGLGLSVVHQLVGHHQGSIRLDSHYQYGCKFVITLPKSEQRVACSLEGRQQVFNGSGRILVVDDEPELLHLCEVILQTAGFQVTTAKDGLLALQKFQQNPQEFDLVLTDFSMPNMSGSDLINALRIIRPELPIILLTGYTKNFSKQDAESMGVNYLLKPVKRSVLLAEVEEQLNASLNTLLGVASSVRH